MKRGRPHRAVTRSRSGFAVVAVALLASATGCAGDEADPDTGSASASGVGTGSATGAQEATCQPVGQDLEADAATTLAIELRDFAFSPSVLEVDAGVVRFDASNVGAENHELAFLPGGGEVPLNAEGEPDEDALTDAGAFELEAFGPGQRCSATYDLEPGTYTVFCIVASADGTTHYDKGMRGRLTVT